MSDLLSQSGFQVTDPDLSDEETVHRGAETSKASIIARLKERGCIFVKNLTGGPILVYSRARPSHVVKAVDLGAGVHLIGAHVNFGLVMAELNDHTTCFTVVEPQQAGGRSVRIPVAGDAYISIRRYTPGDEGAAKSWLWDCYDYLIRAGDKLVLKGLAVPFAVAASRQPAPAAVEA